MENFPEFDYDKLKQESEDASRTKGYLGALGGILNGLKTPSSYEMLHGGKVDRPDYSQMMNQAAGMVEDPLKKRSEMAKAYLENRGLVKAKQEMDDEAAMRDPMSARSQRFAEMGKQFGINTEGLSGKDISEVMGMKKDNIPLAHEFEQDQEKAQLKDPNSKRSMALLALAPRWGVKVEPGMSGYDVMQMIDPKKMMETEATRKAQLEGQKQMADYESRLRDSAADKGMKRDIEKFKIEAGIKNEMGGEKAKFDRMPEDQKQLIEGLSKKNASKVTIASQIDATLKNADKLPEDQKLMQYRQMIKVLNSTEGQDAVGAEEAKRLAGYLEYRLGNVTEPGAFWGRDLPGFEEQAKQTSSALKSAMKTNQGLIDKSFGRTAPNSPIYDFANSGQQKTVINRKINPSTGQTKVIYSDGSEEIVSSSLAGGNK